MEDLAARRQGPFIVTAALILTVCGVLIAIPDSLIAQLERNRPFTDAQAGWAYRLLAFFAIAQLIYAGYSIFRIERVAEARERDPKFAALSKPRMVSSLSRNAASLVMFTVAYGIASVVITGQRGGFWLFPLLAIAQAGWYYREIGQIASWEALQPDEDPRAPAGSVWRQTPPGYCPPITRGLKVLDPNAAPPE